MKNRKLSVEKPGFASFLGCSIIRWLTRCRHTHVHIENYHYHHHNHHLHQHHPYPSTAIGGRLCVLYVLFIYVLPSVSIQVNGFGCALFLPPMDEIPKFPSKLHHIECVNFCCCYYCQKLRQKPKA